MSTGRLCISYHEVMKVEAGKMEGICILDRTFAGNRCFVRIAEPPGDGRLSGDGAPATPFATGIFVSCGLDGTVYSDGDRSSEDLAYGTVRTAQQGNQSVHCAIGGKFLLESDLL